MPKHAVVVGINYVGSGQRQLNGCSNDAAAMSKLLLEHGYSVAALSDAHPSWFPPTKELIVHALHELTSHTAAGDKLLFYFSGHGTRVPTADRAEPDRHDEALVTADFQLILDDELCQLFARVPPTVACTAIVDCCHSRSLFDARHRLIYGDKRHDAAAAATAAAAAAPPTPLAQPAQTAPRFLPLEQVRQLRHRAAPTCAPAAPAPVRRPRALARAAAAPRDPVLLLSACEEGEKCVDVVPRDGSPPFGAFTKALELAYRTNAANRYDNLVWAARSMLLAAGFAQNPCLEGPRSRASASFLQ